MTRTLTVRPASAWRAALQRLLRNSLFGLLLVAALGAAWPGLAQTPQPGLTIAAGAPRGTFQAVLRDLSRVCGRDNAQGTGMPLLLRHTSGSLESLSLLQTGEVQLALVSVDTVLARAQQDGLGDLERVATLHAEQLHVIVLREATPSPRLSLASVRERIDQALGRGPARSLQDLAGAPLASWGGSQVTAARLLARLGIAAEVLDLGSAEEALRALDEGKVRAIMAAGGAPLPWVSALPKGRYRLLPVTLPPAASNGGDRLFHAASLRYDNLGLNSVDTVAVDALLLARRYRKAESRRTLLQLRACLERELDGLADQGHPAWRTVDLRRDPGLHGLSTLGEKPDASTAASRPASRSGERATTATPRTPGV